MCTRLNLSFTINIFSKFQSNPGKNHWEVINQVMRHLKRTKSFCLSCQAFELEVIGYLDY